MKVKKEIDIVEMHDRYEYNVKTKERYAKRYNWWKTGSTFPEPWNITIYKNPIISVCAKLASLLGTGETCLTHKGAIKKCEKIIELRKRYPNDIKINA